MFFIAIKFCTDYITLHFAVSLANQREYEEIVTSNKFGMGRPSSKQNQTRMI